MNENVIGYRLDFVIPAGAIGPVPTFTIGTVVTGAPWTAASVTITTISG